MEVHAIITHKIFEILFMWYLHSVYLWYQTNNLNYTFKPFFYGEYTCFEPAQTNFHLAFADSQESFQLMS